MKNLNKSFNLGNMTINLTTGKLISIIIAISLFLVFIFNIPIFYDMLFNNKIYKNVYIGNTDFGGLSRASAYQKLNNKLEKDFPDNFVTISSPKTDTIIKFSEINLKYNLESTLDNAFKIGRIGSFFDKFYQLKWLRKNKLLLKTEFSYNNSIVDEAVNKLTTDITRKVQNPDLVISSYSIIFATGHDGYSVDIKRLMTDLEIYFGNNSDGIVKPQIKVIKKSTTNTDELYARISSIEKDASIDVADNTVKVIPHVTGRYIDKSELNLIIKQNLNEIDKNIILPVKFVVPALTTQIFTNSLFRDVLAKSTTYFSTNNTNNLNRSVNIKIAVDKITGTILAPGEIFSFNNIVGARNETDGYKLAHSYFKGKIIDSAGGGICQVSTTLYNATIKTNIQTIERTNHMFTVGYVPMGADAAVSYDSSDFKFKNISKWPIKITGSVNTNNSIVFEILGTNENYNKKYELKHIQISTTPFETESIPDPTMIEGQSTVLQNGMNGYVIDTYKLTKIDGKIVDETKLYRSVYKALNKQIQVGTLKVVIPTATQEILTTPKPSNTPAPPSEPTTILPTPRVETTPINTVDDADNPPVH